MGGNSIKNLKNYKEESELDEDETVVKSKHKHAKM